MVPGWVVEGLIGGFVAGDFWGEGMFWDLGFMMLGVCVVFLGMLEGRSCWWGNGWLEGACCCSSSNFA
jgi:hypothetical protein